MRPSDNAIAFDYSAMDAVVASALAVLRVDPAAHMVDTSLDHAADAVHVDSVDLVVDAFPVYVCIKRNFINIQLFGFVSQMTIQITGGG